MSKRSILGLVAAFVSGATAMHASSGMVSTNSLSFDECIQRAISKTDVLASPTQPGGMWAEIVDDNGELFWNIHYARKTTVTGMLYTVEWRPDLDGNWLTLDDKIVPLNPPQSIPGTSYEFVSLRYVTRISVGSPNRFLRVRLLKP